MADTIVKLSKSYSAGDKTFDSVALREPTYRDVFVSGLGQPREWQPAKGGTAVRVIFPDVVDSYLQKLITAPGYEFIGGISAVDGLRLEEAVCDFFTEPKTSETTSTGSSSERDSTHSA